MRIAAAAAAALPQLASMGFDNNRITLAMPAEIPAADSAAAGPADLLARLQAQKVATAATAVARAAADLPHLVELDLCANPIDDDAAAQLCAALVPAAPALSSLLLAGTGAGDRAAAAVATALSTATLPASGGGGGRRRPTNVELRAHGTRPVGQRRRRWGRGARGGASHRPRRVVDRRHDRRPRSEGARSGAERAAARRAADAAATRPRRRGASRDPAQQLGRCGRRGGPRRFPARRRRPRRRAAISSVLDPPHAVRQRHDWRSGVHRARRRPGGVRDASCPPR